MNPANIDVDRAYKKLKELWNNVKTQDECQDAEIKTLVEELLESTKHSKAFKYALITQLLAKVVEPQIDIFSIQACDKKARGLSFDARSFCKKVVVKADNELWGGILGSSSDPYVSKPLRFERFQPPEKAKVKNKKAYLLLYELLNLAQTSSSNALNILNCVLSWIKNRVELNIHPPKLENISLDMLCKVIEVFSKKTGSMLGAVPQYMVYALFLAISEVTGVYGKVITGKATESDATGGKPSDIVVYDKSGNPKIIVSVTDKIDDIKLREEIKKAQHKNIQELMIIAREITISQHEKEGTFPIYYRVYNLAEFITTMAWAINADVRERFIRKLYEVFKEKKEFEILIKLDEIVKHYLIKKDT